MRTGLRLPTLAIAGVLLVAACTPSAASPSVPSGASQPAAPSAAPSGASGAPSAPAGAIPEQGVDDGATITMWSRAATETRVQSQVDAYNATHQNKVELRLVPTDEYVGVVGNAATANELPDLFSADVVFMPNWTSQGLFLDITDRIDGLPGIDNVGQAHIVASSWEGKKYGLPFIIDLSVWMYNKDLFEQAGLDPEDAPTTLAEFADAAREVQALDIDGHVRHLLRRELRRMQRLHLVADHLGRGWRRHERGWHRGHAQHRHGQGDLSGPSAPCGTRASSTRNPSRKPAPPGPNRSPRGRSASCRCRPVSRRARACRSTTSV